MARKTIFMLMVGLFLFVKYGYAQQSMPSAFGSIESAEGSIDYSLGQVFIQTYSGPDGELLQGIHLPIEVFPVGIDDFFFSNPMGNTIQMNTYPNPSSNQLSIYIPDLLSFTDEFTYALYSIQGEMLTEGNMTQETTKLDLSGHHAGQFFLRIIKGKQAVKTFKIIKR